MTTPSTPPGNAEGTVFLPAVLLSVVAGACMAVQGRANGELAQVTGNPMEASLFSMASGFVALLLAMVARGPRSGVGRALRARREGRLHPLWLMSGVLGAVLLFVQSWVVPLVGVAMFTVAFVAGQTSNALVIDRFGLGPGGPRPVGPLRIAAALLAIVGVTLALTGHGTLALALLPVIASLLVGMTNMLQQAWNGQVSVASRSVYVGTLTNFGVGTVALIAVVIVQALLGHSLGPAHEAPWWAWTGGLLGVVFIAVGAWAGRHVGILVFAVMSLLGNLGMAVVLDVLNPAHPGEFGLSRLLGVVVTFIAAALATWAGRPRRPAS